MFINIIKNALQAMPQGGCLKVTLPLHDRQMEISFQDTGPGLTPEEMDQIFEPFYSTKEGTQGLGLGLPICQKILERYDGRLVVESQPGQGTNVRVLLPYRESGGSAWPIKTSWSWMTMPWYASPSRRCSSWKASAPMRCWMARPPWPKSRPTTISVILSDIQMPGLNGIELLKELKGRSPDTTIIFITGHGHIAGAVEAIKLGAYDYIVKPIDDLRLKLTISHALEQKKLQASYDSLKKRLKPWNLDETLVFGDRKMDQLLELVHTIADTMATVLITGESGTGKSMLAHYIHTAFPPPGRALCQDQLRFAVRDPAGERAFRACAGLLYRRHPG